MLVGIGLVAVYLGYSQLTSPWLKVEQKQQSAVTHSPAHESSIALVDRAATWFKGDSWVSSANARFGDGSRFVYFQEHELLNEDKSIKVAPLAILWQDDETKTPYTLTAESAHLDATTKFRLETNQFGEISSGQLRGDVRITGPDGLRIEGRSFSVTDKALKILSSQPVKFWWGTHSGIAHGGAEIELLSSGDVKQQGLMSITDVQRIRLLGRVSCDLFFPDDDPKNEAIKLRISAANGFEFFVPTHEATFFGFSDRELRKDNQILVERQTASGAMDQLFCSKLTLQLQPVVREPDAKQQSSAQLQLSSIQAEGPRVIFRSSEQNVTATMNRLKYYIEERVMELAGSVTATTGRQKPVQIHQKGSMLTSSRIVVVHDADNQIQTIRCLGSGQIGRSDLPSAPETREATIDAFWTESLIVRQFPEQKVTLKGKASVSQVSPDEDNEGVRLSGDLIEMTGTLATEDSTKIPSSKTSSQNGGIDLSHISPKQMLASGNVILAQEGVTGNVREKLTVNFVAVSGISERRNAVTNVSQTSSSQDATAESATNTRETDITGHTEFSCDTAQVSVEFSRGDGGKLNGEFRDVWLLGKVTVDHKGLKQEGNFLAEGSALSAESGFSGSQEINLYGDPAVVRRASDRIEGPQINLKELQRGTSVAQREARVEGSGSIRFVVSQGLNGKQSPRPSLLEIYWTESMVYSEQTANFVGNIRAVMSNDMDHKLGLTCASMKVYFVDGFQLQRSNQKQEKNVFQVAGSSSRPSEDPIERIECNSKVVVDIDQLKDGLVESRNHAEFSDLTVNLKTGAFSATGSGSSGVVESTQPNSEKNLRTTPRAVARANVPVSTPTDAFVFVQARFIGGIEGNYKEKFVQLKQHVRGVFGPVREIGNRIVLDGLAINELPPNTGSMRCENLSFYQIGTNDNEASQFAMVAESNTSDGYVGTRAPCHLESLEISGDADKITFDSSKQQFILSADKGRQATVAYRRAPGAAPEMLSGQQFEYYREKNEIRATEITGVQTAGDLKAPRN